MALTIKHLNTDASFLLAFEPLVSRPAPGYEPQAFHILLDPWITGPSKIFHRKISLTRQKDPACISSLRELPEPDLVIISSHKSDHCNEATLKQMPPEAKTIILAEPAAARLIRSWKHFDRHKVRALKRWEDPRANGSGNSPREDVTRIPMPPIITGGDPGEVTVAYIPQRRDLSGLHAAIGITYRPPPLTAHSSSLSPPSQRKYSHSVSSWTSKSLSVPRVSSGPRTPPPPPTPYSNLPTASSGHAAYPPLGLSGSNTTNPTPLMLTNDTNSLPMPMPMPTPTSPVTSVRSVRSASTLTGTLTGNNTQHASAQRTLSVLFSPHGIVFPGSLASYATSHLINEAALPLTALLHCFDSATNPWWLGGHVVLGAPAGREIAVRLGARAWVSCHDGDKEVRGLVAGWLRVRRWGRGEVEKAVTEGVGDEKLGTGDDDGGGDEAQRRSLLTTCSSVTAASVGKGAGPNNKATQVIDLAGGEEVVLTSEGVWNVDRLSAAISKEEGGTAVPETKLMDAAKGRDTKLKEKKSVSFSAMGEVMGTESKIVVRHWG